MKREKFFYSPEGKVSFILSMIFFIFFFIILVTELMRAEETMVRESAFLALGFTSLALFFGVFFFAFTNRVLDKSKSHIFRGLLVIPLCFFLTGFMSFVNMYYKNLLGFGFINIFYVVAMTILLVESYLSIKAKYG